MIEIAGRKIGPEQPPYFVADVGANHDGDLDRAKRLIALAAEARADAVKFQNFRAETLVSRRGFEEVGQVAHQAAWEEGIYETYEAGTTPFDWTPALVEACRDSGVAYLTTPYDLELLDQLDPYVPAWKIGSGDITYMELIRVAASKGKPLLLAVGASYQYEVDLAVEKARAALDGAGLIVMQCNSDYSGGARPSELNLGVLPVWRRTWRRAQVGLSDHTPGYLAVTTAVALGASVVEKHLTDDRSRRGPDHGFAMLPGEFREMVEASRRTREMLGEKKVVEASERGAAVVQRRALRWQSRLRPGAVVRRWDVTPTRPCPPDGLSPESAKWLEGRRLGREVEPDTLVRWEDFE